MKTCRKYTQLKMYASEGLSYESIHVVWMWCGSGRIPAIFIFFLKISFVIVVTLDSYQQLPAVGSCGRRN